MPAWALGQRQLLLVPNVNQSGKSHHPPALGDRCSESGVPNVNRSGKSHHALINAWLGKVSRTSTNRASPITRLQAPQPRFMKRPERQPLGQVPSHAAGGPQAGSRPSRTSTARASPFTFPVTKPFRHNVSPERQPLRQVPSPDCCIVPNVNRSGKSHHARKARTSRARQVVSRTSTARASPITFNGCIYQPAVCDPRTSTARASHITLLGSTNGHHLDVPNVNRSGKSHHPHQSLSAPWRASPLTLLPRSEHFQRQPVPNVNRSGKSHHPA
jgi:hypothetical protein